MSTSRFALSGRPQHHELLFEPLMKTRSFLGVVVNWEIILVSVLKAPWILDLWMKTRGNLIDPVALVQAISVTISLGFLKPFASFSHDETSVLFGMSFQ